MTDMMNLRQPDNPGLPTLPLIGPLAKRRMQAACLSFVLVRRHAPRRSRLLCAT